MEQHLKQIKRYYKDNNHGLLVMAVVVLSEITVTAAVGISLRSILFPLVMCVLMIHLNLTAMSVPMVFQPVLGSSLSNNIRVSWITTNGINPLVFLLNKL